MPLGKAIYETNISEQYNEHANIPSANLQEAISTVK